LEIPTQYYGFLGAKFSKPICEEVPEIDGLSVAATQTGYPVSAIREDTEYLRFLYEGRDPQIIEEGGQLPFEANWGLRGGQSMTPFNIRVLRKNLATLKTTARLEISEDRFWSAFSIMIEELLNVGCGGFQELSEEEAWFGLEDGSLNPINMNTAVGAVLSKLGESKKVAFQNAPGLYVTMMRDDYDRISNFKDRPYAWISKTSLKDARLDNIKISQDKGRIFQAQSVPVSMTGRRLTGNFTAAFTRACKRGGFFGVIGFILSRGGWHKLLGELSDNFERMITYPGDVSKWDKNWLNHWHMVLVWLLAVLCDDPILAKKICRHYDRVVRSPTLVAIIGIIIVLTKGQPSGDVNTITFNTIILAFMYILAYLAVAPKEFWNAGDCFSNMILRAGGDDSITTLSANMRSWLGNAGMSWEDLVRTTFSQSGWEIILEEKMLIDAEFMGYGSTLPTLEDKVGVMFLPALPLNAVMSIDEWYKTSKNSDVPEKVRQLARYFAGVEKAFPHLFSRDPDARAYAKIALQWLKRVQNKYWEDPSIMVSKAARGIPSLSAVAELYFGYPVPLQYIYAKF